MALYPGDAVLGMGVDQSGSAQNLPVRTHNTAKASTQRGVTIAGSDGTNDYVIKVDNTGRLDVTGSTVTLDFSGTPDAAAPAKAAFTGGMGEAAAEVLDEGDLGALSLTLGSELRVIEESTSAAGGAAAPVRTLQVGAKGNAAPPASVDENDILPLSATLAGALRTRVEAVQAAFDAAAPAASPAQARPPAARNGPCRYGRNRRRSGARWRATGCRFSPPAMAVPPR